jgi:RNA polymerase sigma factor (TIGR02999 family)
MTPALEDDFAGLLRRAQLGDAAARDELVGLIYRDIRALAARRMRRERLGHTLQPTALADEALVKILADNTLANATSRTFLYQAAAKAMGQVLIDHERKRNAQKRLGRLRRTPLDAALEHLTVAENVSLADLHEALDDLGRLNERRRLVVEYKFFLGMTDANVAGELGISQKTVERDWRFARGWLFERLKPTGDA